MMKRFFPPLFAALLLLTSSALAAPEPAREGGGGATEPQAASDSGAREPGESHEGAITEAIRRFQRERGLDPDGVVGPKTRAALMLKDGEKEPESGAIMVAEADDAKASDKDDKDDEKAAEDVKASDKDDKDDEKTSEDAKASDKDDKDDEKTSEDVKASDKDDRDDEKTSEDAKASDKDDRDDEKEPEADNAKTAEANSAGDVPRGEPVWVEAVAYSPEGAGMGEYTVLGLPCGRGVIAVDPDFIPLGTRVYIPGYGEAIAADTGASIIGNIIDICFDTYDESAEFGRQQIEIYILEYPSAET
ncbi:MAG: peptidoglycan-binding protein [Schwartzia sp.]|nr:peptidoglycan-binding protein [Schwartzia sp. (in: firmicutes)]